MAGCTISKAVYDNGTDTISYFSLAQDTDISAKSVPSGLNPFAALTVTYLVGAVVSAVLFFVLGKQSNPIKELSNLNWAPFELGLVIVGLEVGFIYAYKAGWTVSTAALVQGVALAIILIFVGFCCIRKR